MTLRSILSIINIFLIGFLLGKHVQEDYYTPKPVPSSTVTAPSDSLVAANDSIMGEHHQTINRMTDDYARVRDLVGKYEAALEDMKIHRPEAYQRFIRIAEFKEEYTEDIRGDFINEHRRAIRRSQL